jgi:hypothetical protein
MRPDGISTAEHLEEATKDPKWTPDVVAAMAEQQPDGFVLTPELDLKCRRHIDFFLLPVMFISFGLFFMDKQCLTGAALFGIIQDLDLFAIVTYDGHPVLSLQKYSYISKGNVNRNHLVAMD